MMSSSSLSYLTLVVSIHLLGLFHPSLAANTAAWKSRSIYQTMTDRFARTDGSTTAKCNTTAGLYCGGTWRGTTNHLDYIQGMGFDAVMISPIVENVQGHVSYGESYHGYWPLDLYSLNSHFGTHQDLLDLSKALHDRDMYLMMDTVINNMAYITNGNNPATNIDYSAFTPFNNSDYFHEYCKIHDWNDWDEAQMCQTGDNKVALPDLYTEHEDVQHMLASWANEMIKTYSIDGLRIDAAKHVNNASLQNFQNNVDVFMTGEVLQREVETICNYQGNYINSVPNYPIYYSMLEAFTKGNTTDLFHQVEIMKQSCRDITAFVSFSENHDIQRIPSWMPEMAIAKNTLTFTMLFDGIPMIYQGQEQHFSGGGQPANREALWLSKYDTSAELYKLITKLNLLRKHAINLGHDYVDEQTSPIYVGASELVFRKGVEGRHTIMVLSNQGSKGGAYTIDLPVSYNAGTTVMDVLSCANYTVLDAGQLRVKLDKGEPRVLFPADMLEGSGLCGRPLHNITLTEVKTGEKPSSGSRIVLTGSAVVVGVLSVAATLVL